MIASSDILKASILIVDDQVAHASLLEQMLREAGYDSIATTNDPHEVCELHRKNHYALILLDLQMPGLNGFQVMEGLKAIETGGYLPVLVLTAQPDHKLRALKAGARDFVSKPFELTEVLMRVQNMIEVRLLHRETKSALAEKEVLLREVHHRVKNNMQVISSLLQLQCAYLHDVKDAQIFQECQLRIRSMALVHERLYQSNSLATINFAEYLEDLSVLIVRSQSNLVTKVKLIKDYDSIELGLDAAIPLGLVANELISNAFKHAFPGREQGILTLRLKRAGIESFLFSVSDDGVGLPKNFKADNKKSLGLRLIENLARQLRATLSFGGGVNMGCHTELTLPLHLEEYSHA